MRPEPGLVHYRGVASKSSTILQGLPLTSLLAQQRMSGWVGWFRKGLPVDDLNGFEIPHLWLRAGRVLQKLWLRAASQLAGGDINPNPDPALEKSHHRRGGIGGAL